MEDGTREVSLQQGKIERRYILGRIFPRPYYLGARVVDIQHLLTCRESRYTLSKYWRWCCDAYSNTSATCRELRQYVAYTSSGFNTSTSDAIIETTSGTMEEIPSDDIGPSTDVGEFNAAVDVGEGASPDTKDS
jgi:hypothetical protein